MKRISLALILLLSCGWLYAGELVVSFLNCGQGDAAVIKTPGGKTYLIDTGPNDKEYGGDYDAGEKVVVPYLQFHRTQEIEGILISHPHLDHYGGTFAVIRALPVKELMDSGYPSLAPPYLKLLKEVELKKIHYRVIKEGAALEWDKELIVQVLWPSNEILNRKAKKKMDNLNDRSVVLKITHGKNTFLFPGDAEKTAEGDLVKKWGHELQCKVLKAPHHASKTSSTKDFLEAVNPQLAVISCGKKNQFGHPHASVLKRLEEKNISVYRTDRDGTVEITSDGNDLSVKVLSPSQK